MGIHGINQFRHHPPGGPKKQGDPQPHLQGGPQKPGDPQPHLGGGQGDRGILGMMKDNGIRPTGDKNADMQRLMQSMNGGDTDTSNNNQQTGFNEPSQEAMNNPMDKAILGMMKAFGIKPTGDKGADMQKLMQVMSGGDNNSGATATAFSALG